MAKDPAFLFYSNDFASGTQFFSDEQVGKYIRLLIAQHQHGHLTEKQVIIISKSYDNEVMEKFAKDDSGKFYNIRLESEIDRRKSFSESRSRNKQGKTKSNDNDIKNKTKSYDNHMENENENETKDKIKKAKNEFNLIYPFTSDAFMNGWTILSKEKKWRNKSSSALQASLKKLSKYDEQTAIKMIEDCIAGEWQGLVEPKNNYNNGHNTDSKPEKIGRISIDDLREFAKPRHND